MDLVENGRHKGDESGTRKGATGKIGIGYTHENITKAHYWYN